MCEVEEPLAEGLVRVAQGRGPARIVVQIEGLFTGRPAQVVLVSLPVRPDLGCPVQDAAEGRPVVDASDVHARSPHGPVHRGLLGRPLHVAVRGLGIDLGQEVVAHEAPGQLAVVHEAGGRCAGAQQIHVAQDRHMQAPFLEDLEQLLGLAPVPTDLRDEEPCAAGDLLLHLVVLLNQRRLGVLEGRDCSPCEEPVCLCDPGRVRLDQGLVVHPGDHAQGPYGLDLIHALRGNGPVPCQDQQGLHAHGLVCGQAAGDRGGVVVFARDVGDQVQVSGQTLSGEPM